GDATGSITRITAPGMFSTIATGVGVPTARGNGRLEAMGFDAAGNLYVGDKFGNAVWKFAPPGIATGIGRILNDDVPTVATTTLLKAAANLVTVAQGTTLT